LSKNLLEEAGVKETISVGKGTNQFECFFFAPQSPNFTISKYHKKKKSFITSSFPLRLCPCNKFKMF
jgi:hypothetical protein